MTTVANSNEPNEKSIEVSERIEIPKGYFGIEKSELVTLFDKCGRNESFDEDIQEIVRLGGTEAILSKIKTSFEKGISETDTLDIKRRIFFYGENKFIVEPMHTLLCVCLGRS